MTTQEEARRILATADLVCSEQQVAAAVTRLAGEITTRLHDSYPLLLTVMNGGLIFAGQLLPQLLFPLQCAYLHATRYRQDNSGGELQWLVEPPAVSGRSVLVLDDVLDRGLTLAAIKQKLLQQGAAECLLAVLAEKQLGTAKPVEADFVGVTLPDRYVFGCGMDAGGVWRNLPAIYALNS